MKLTHCQLVPKKGILMIEDPVEATRAERLTAGFYHASQQIWDNLLISDQEIRVRVSNQYFTIVGAWPTVLVASRRMSDTRPNISEFSSAKDFARFFLENFRDITPLLRVLKLMRKNRIDQYSRSMMNWHAKEVRTHKNRPSYPRLPAVKSFDKPHIIR